MSGTPSRARVPDALCTIAFVLVGPAMAGAQIPGVPAPERPRARAELRLDAFSARVDALQLGGAIAFPAGTYLRLAAAAGAGVARAPEIDDAPEETGFSARAEVLARFHLDPMRQSRWGPYLAGGLGIRSDFEECCRGNLTLLVGVERSTRSGRAWAFELGFGNGVRAAIAFRGGGGRWR